uniref:Retrotransposon protein, putative, unclassified n=1 Tax=Oryza sativa subsp. japonica TaxID=39947 RepID=Q8S6X1_ORYSJ|nr:Hypothetical protein [Oryza sativa Japonica Group]
MDSPATPVGLSPPLLSLVLRNEPCYTKAVHGNGRPRSTLSKTDGRDRSVHDRLTANRHDDVSGDVIDDVSTGSGSAARARMLAGEQQRFGTNGEHQDVERDAANSPMTKEAAEDQRMATATSGGEDRVDGGDGAPAVNSDCEGADEDGEATATTMTTFPSDGDDWNDGGARLERRRRRRR